MDNFAIKKYIEFFRLNPGINSASAALCMLFPIEDFAVPVLTGQIVDAIKQGRPWVNKLIALAVVLGVAQVVYFTSSFVDARLMPAMQNYIRNSMFRNVLEGKSEAFADIQTGQMLSKMIKIPAVVVSVTELFKKDLLPYFIGLLAVSVSIFRTDKVIGVIVIAMILFAFYQFVYAPRRCGRPAAKLEESIATMYEETEDVMRNGINVFSANQTESELQRIKVYERGYLRDSWRLLMCTVKYRAYVIVGLAIMLGVVGYRCYRGITDRTLSVGVFVTVFSSLNTLFATLNWLASRINSTVYEWGILDSFVEATKGGGDGGAHVGVPPNLPKEGLLVYDVTYRVPGRRAPLLQGVSLYVPPGQRLAIVGSIGSGKSTLLKLLVRLITPTTGEIYLNGKAYSSTDAHETRALIAYVQQNPLLFNRSIYENITYGVPGATPERVDALLASTKLADVFAGLDDGMNTRAGKNGCNLSGGQRQVISCVRTILVDPAIVVLDEVTASLDPAMKQRMIGLFDVMFKDKIVVFATHDKELLRFATSTVRIEDGRLTTVGS